MKTIQMYKHFQMKNIARYLEENFANCEIKQN